VTKAKGIWLYFIFYLIYSHIKDEKKKCKVKNYNFFIIFIFKYYIHIVKPL
jgi:hypothetical protein